MYRILDKSNLSWNCIICGMPNFSTAFFNSIIPELSNTYSDQGLAQVHMNLLGECYIGMSIPVYHI
jgi:hypothetical protein